ncbi:MAG: outer membrane lipoprotein chaperone LolA [Pseudomonadota bacterium]
MLKMLTRPWPRAAGLLFLLLASQPQAQDNGAARVESFLEGLDSFKAQFAQTVVTDQAIQGPVEGTFYLKRPGRFRWEYAGDEGQLIVADGKRVWLLDRGLEQISHRSQAGALRGTPAQLLSGQGDWKEAFSARDGGERDGLQWVELTPTDAESQFERLRIGFSGERLARIEMTDKLGQHTYFVFSDVERNAALSGDLFTFRPPPGFDVFEH